MGCICFTKSLITIKWTVILLYLFLLYGNGHLLCTNVFKVSLTQVELSLNRIFFEFVRMVIHCIINFTLFFYQGDFLWLHADELWNEFKHNVGKLITRCFVCSKNWTCHELLHEISSESTISYILWFILQTCKLSKKDMLGTGMGSLKGVG